MEKIGLFCAVMFRNNASTFIVASIISDNVASNGDRPDMILYFMG